MDATIPDAEQGSPLAPVTTSQNGLNATIKSRQTRRETARDRNRRTHDPEQPTPSTSVIPTTAVTARIAPRKDKGVVRTPAQVDGEEGGNMMDESQTYDVERDLYDITGTPMMDLSVRPARRIPPTYRASSSRTRHRTSSPTTTNPQDRDHERERGRDGRKSSSRYREREGYLERDAPEDREHLRDPMRLPGVSFGSPIAASSPPNARRSGGGQSYERPGSITATSSFSSRTSFGSPTSTTSPVVGIMAGPLGLGFTPSETDAYLGIQIACEKIAKTHGFQSAAVFRVYQEVKDLRKAEEIVIGMQSAAEKDAIERIMKVREKTGKRRTSERVGESSSLWGGGKKSRASRRGYEERDQEEGEDGEETDRRAIHEDEEDDPDSSLRIEHLSHNNKRPSTSSTSALRYRGGYDKPGASTTTVRKRERDQVHGREGSVEYHPPTPTRANLWERLSKSGRHPETALLGESLRASLSMPRYDHE